MKRSLFVTSLISCLLIISPAYAAKIGLLVVATGRYIQFVEPLIASADEYFCKNHRVIYFVFTDGEVPQRPDVIKIEQKRLGWPYDTLMRCGMYADQRKLLVSMDYLFACDADMLFVDTVGDEILSDRVATQHPGYVNKRGTYETNANSCACVRRNEGECYFAGGFYGGRTQEFLTMNTCMMTNIKYDLQNKIVAVWHDESHLNRYFIDHKPTKILSPSYCYPESWSIPYQKRLIALDKNHKALRASDKHK